MSLRVPTMLQAPMAVASDGSILVNAVQLGSGQATFDEVIANARAMGLRIFIGVAVPSRLQERFIRETDNALADVVGRLAARLVCRRQLR